MERLIAVLLKMQLTSAQIASTLFLSQRTVEHHRNHIRKKLSLSPKDEIHRVLVALEKQQGPP
jgi:DNA-binding CsgD family transcriptional regulator